MKTQFLLLTLLLFASSAFAQTRNLRLVKPPIENPTIEKRKAVVIGMSDYGSREKNLPDAFNDADDMAGVLTQLGFEVTLLKNNDLQNLETNLNNWYKTIERNDMAIFYYAGHGMKIKEVNYLIPVDFPADVEEANVKYKALSVGQVLDNMDEKQVGMKLLILDACQDNPFKRSWSRGGEEKGLAEMKAPTGIYILFSSWPGSTAQEGGRYNLRNGVFTYYLKQEIVKEGASIDDIINNVAGEVSDLTGKQQMPYKSGILTKNFYFKPKVVGKYYYYIDQNGNESKNRFEDRRNAESEMKSRNLYGKIYSNAGEIFVVDKPAPYNPAPTPVANTYSFTDDFSDNHNNWCTGTDNYGMTTVANGKYRISCTNEYRNIGCVIPTALDNNKDFTCSVTAKWIEGIANNGFGIRFCCDENLTTGYIFTISAYGSYSVDYKDPNEFMLKDLIAWTESSSIYQNNILNTLKVERKGNFVNFYINDTTVNTIPFDGGSGNLFGLIVYGKQTVEFDNFELRGVRKE